MLQTPRAKTPRLAPTKNKNLGKNMLTSIVAQNGSNGTHTADPANVVNIPGMVDSRRLIGRALAPAIGGEMVFRGTDG